jgi:hypothetical protein
MMGVGEYKDPDPVDVIANYSQMEPVDVVALMVSFAYIDDVTDPYVIARAVVRGLEAKGFHNGWQSTSGDN